MGDKASKSHTIIRYTKYTYHGDIFKTFVSAIQNGR
jgi:hypothetical protein